MYKNYIPELPDKYNEINNKIHNKNLRTKNEDQKKLFWELCSLLDRDRQKMESEYQLPGDKQRGTFYGYPLEEITIERISDFWPYVAEDYSQEQLKAIKIGHLYILDNTHRKKGHSYFETNLDINSIKEVILNNKVIIDPCLIKFGYDYDYYGCSDIARFKLEKGYDNSYFISNWS